jgi:hypothetical protein
MRARALPPDAPARRHVRAVVLAIACTSFALPSERVQYVYEYVCAWVHGCLYASVRVRAYVSLRLLLSPQLASPPLAPPPLPFSPVSSSLLAPASFPLACFLSPPLASPVPCYPLPFPSLPFSSLASSPPPSPRFASPGLSPSLSSSLPSLLRG